MNKKMRELLQKIEEKTVAAKDFLSGNETKGIEKDVEKANKLLDEIDALKAEFEAEKRVYELEKAENTPTDEEIEKDVKDKANKSQKATFLKAVREGLPKATSNTEGADADGGYIVPEEISTQIEHYREARFSLKSLVRVYPVSTNAGARTFKTKSTQTGFTNVTEMGKIGGKTALAFERLEYAIKKYGGYLPVSNELLEDTDAALEQEIVSWLGDEGIATDNTNILTVMKTFTSKTLTAAGILDEIKTILNVDLGQAYKNTSAVITNDSGLNILDTLKDSDGNYILQPHPQDPMKLQLCAGATTVPVIVVPNSVLANDTTNVPFFIGDAYEAVAFFDRKQLSLMASNTASVTGFNAFEQDCTLWRALMREDVKKRDANAMYFAALNTAGE